LKTAAGGPGKGVKFVCPVKCGAQPCKISRCNSFYAAAGKGLSAHWTAAAPEISLGSLKKMKRVLLAVALCAPLALPFAAAAEGVAKDPFTQGNAEAAKAAVCAACHGPAGNSSNPVWPKLAAQGSRFTFEQLQAFKAGHRNDPLMGAQAAALSEQDMRDLAAYFAAQPGSPGVGSPSAVAVAQPLYRAGDAKRGLPACGSCHGPGGAGVPAAAYPHIGGQHAVYVANRLRAYRDAAATELPDGNLKIMAAVAAQLTDAEIEALASYVNGLQ
jgi:cytochrome c553